MKKLGPAMIAVLLAACGQGPQEVSQAPFPSRPETPETGDSQGDQTRPGALKPIVTPPQPLSTPTQPESTQPEVTQPANPHPGEIEPVKPETPVAPATPRVPAPGQSEQSEAEQIARKLISTDPGDNLEVLNDALERWLAEKGNLPERVSDLVGEQFLPMLPMAPFGKAFVIDADNRRVVLVAEK